MVLFSPKGSQHSLVGGKYCRVFCDAQTLPVRAVCLSKVNFRAGNAAFRSAELSAYRLVSRSTNLYKAFALSCSGKQPWTMEGFPHWGSPLTQFHAATTVDFPEATGTQEVILEESGWASIKFSLTWIGFAPAPIRSAAASKAAWRWASGSLLTTRLAKATIFSTAMSNP